MRTLMVKKSTLYNTDNEMVLTIPIGFNLVNGNLNKTICYSSCREIAIRNYANFMISTPPNDENFARRYKANKRIIQSKSRVIFPGTSNKMFNDVISGKTLKTLHLIEKTLGMTKTYPVELLNCDGSRGNRKKLMFVGSNKWYRSSHTMSLWLLILRLGFRVPEFTGKTIDDLARLAKKYPKTSNYGGNTATVDKTYVKHTFHSWMPLMQNLNSIFSPKILWRNRFDVKKVHIKLPNHIYGGGSVGTEGISRLIKDSRHLSAPKFKKMLNKMIKKSK